MSASSGWNATLPSAMEDQPSVRSIACAMRRAVARMAAARSAIGLSAPAMRPIRRAAPSMIVKGVRKSWLVTDRNRRCVSTTAFSRTSAFCKRRSIRCARVTSCCAIISESRPVTGSVRRRSAIWCIRKAFPVMRKVPCAEPLSSALARRAAACAGTANIAVKLSKPGKLPSSNRLTSASAAGLCINHWPCSVAMEIINGEWRTAAMARSS